MQIPETIGRYRVVERVGRGGMGVLYRAFDAMLDREVAIKVMSADFIADGQERFFREARAVAKLQHRNIVTIFDLGEDNGQPFIVMEFLKGCDLARRVKLAPPLAFEQKLAIMVELCAALDFAHEQEIVHRDVKPANIWLLDDGHVKLLDFGIAKLTAQTMTRTSALIGSPFYMSPEQAAGGAVDGRSDIFSAGIVLYELLSGQKPFDAESPTAVLLKIIGAEPRPIEQQVPDLPVSLASVVKKALEKDPESRFQRARQLGAALAKSRTRGREPVPVAPPAVPAFDARHLDPDLAPVMTPPTPRPADRAKPALRPAASAASGAPEPATRLAGDPASLTAERTRMLRLQHELAEIRAQRRRRTLGTFFRRLALLAFLTAAGAAAVMFGPREWVVNKVDQALALLSRILTLF